jgi:hypothetical protein
MRNELHGVLPDGLLLGVKRRITSERSTLVVI